MFEAFQGEDSPITIHEGDDGWAAVQFPFELKDQFKKAFPSAKWDRFNKAWKVGPRTKQRLLDWANEALEAAGAIEEKKRVDAEARIVGKELEAIREELRSLSESNRVTKDSLEVLARQKDELAEARERKAQLQAEVKENRQSVTERIEAVIDQEAVNEAESTMARYHRQVGNPARDLFHKAQETIREAKGQLEAAGLRLQAIDYLGGANFNRPDRDHPQFMPENAWHAVEEIEPSDEA